MKKEKRTKRNTDAETPATPAGKALWWCVVFTCVAALVLLMWLARDILGQLTGATEKSSVESTRLLTGLFVVMCFAGFVAAALWAALKKAWGEKKE